MYPLRVIDYQILVQHIIDHIQGQRFIRQFNMLGSMDEMIQIIIIAKSYSIMILVLLNRGKLVVDFLWKLILNIDGQ